MVSHCVDTIGFIFDKASVKIKHKKKKVPKSSNTSSLTTICTTYKDKRTSSSESNPYYSSEKSSISMPCLNSSKFGSCNLSSSCNTISSNCNTISLSSSCSSLSSNCSSSKSSSCNSKSSSCNSKSSSCNSKSSSCNSKSSSCNSCSTPSISLNSDKKLKIDSSSSKNCSDSLKYIKHDYNPCIKPICYEPSICGDNKHNKKKCSHKNKKKFKTDIFNKLNKYCLIKLTKENFMSSTLSVCTDNKDDCWLKFTENLYELLGGSFLITFTKCNIFRTLYCQLLKIDYCMCCQELKLFFKYNLLPPKKIEEECYNNINNIDLYYKLENCVYNNLRFYYDREYNFNPRNFINI